MLENSAIWLEDGHLYLLDICTFVLNFGLRSWQRKSLQYHDLAKDMIACTIKRSIAKSSIGTTHCKSNIIIYHFLQDAECWLLQLMIAFPTKIKAPRLLYTIYLFHFMPPCPFSSFRPPNQDSVILLATRLKLRGIQLLELSYLPFSKSPDPQGY